MNFIWLKRDLRLNYNQAIQAARFLGLTLQPIFIFDDAIVSDLAKDDSRVNFIYDELEKIHQELRSSGSSLWIFKGSVLDVWTKILSEYKVENVFWNKDFEPYALKRDATIKALLRQRSITCHEFLDHILFEPDEILKKNGTPYTVYTPYKNKWIDRFNNVYQSTKFDHPKDIEWNKGDRTFPSKNQLEIKESEIKVKPVEWDNIINYGEYRDFPAKSHTSNLGPHLRFGTVSVQEVLERKEQNDVFQSEIIWRSFFTQILYHFPNVIHQSFKTQYDNIQWLNDESAFEKWKEGRTGYPIVDAGMRELNQTGYMHNRVRMVCASFLVKHLLIDWRWGEAYFAEKLLDFELASNNGNWQWAAGTGCDAAPYFRVFNPTTQQEKFDKNMVYIQRWVPEIFTNQYPKPIVDHKMARLRAIETYKKGLGK